MCIGDMVRYNTDEYNDRLGEHGIIIEVNDKLISPATVTVLWNTQEFENVFADELEVINKAKNL